jgi:hypothetical protein
MGYVKTQEAVAAYDHFYEQVNSELTAAGVAFTTTKEFARSVLPPCFEVPDPPTGSLSVLTNCEEIDGNRTGADEEGAVLSLDVLYEGQAGSYTLSVFVNNDQSLATGREGWAMPKKLGEVHLMGNGMKRVGIAYRKGAEMRFETTLGRPTFTESPSATTSIFYEIKTGLNAAGGLQHAPVLIEFEVTQYTYLHQDGDTTKSRIVLKGTEDDPVDTVPVKSLTSAFYSGYTMHTRVKRQIELGSSVDYRPYMYGRFFDDWPRTARKM